jgi:5-(carboxyamino)imidazole ribonucleotide synthase
MPKAPIIALLGGGQLGRMFLENALRYDAEVHVLDPDSNCSCARIAHRFVQGSFNDKNTVISFAREADIVGIEIEHVSVEALRELKAMGKRVIPDPEVLYTIKDKGLQKEFYASHGIPSSPFALVSKKEEIAAHEQLMPGFLKARIGGYDGKGVMAIRNEADIAGAFDGPCVLERSADIELELAVIVVRGTNGSMVCYDPVEMVFDERYNLVDHLRAPARIPEALSIRARNLAEQVARAFGQPGIYAVEMFLTKRGDLWVNETAPRAHNSGHHTIEACASSQFDQLLRLYLDRPLGSTRMRGTAAMINIVGEGGTGPAEVKGWNEVLALPDTFIHLYGKSETRTGRKMGHVTAMAHDHAALDLAIDTTRTHCKVVPAMANALPADR